LIGNPRYQFDVFGDTSESARAVSEALRVALDGLVRCPLDATETIYECRLDGEVDSYEPNADGSEGGLFRQILDFLFWHKRS
jgi:hypothetical protein